MQKIVLLGPTGNNADVLDAIDEINALRPTYDVLGYVRGDGHLVPRVKLQFLGDYDAVHRMPEDILIAGFAFGVKTYRSWPDTVARFGFPPDRFATIVHPRAYISPRSQIGHGSIILAGTTLGADVTVGNHVVILQNVALSHDTVIEDFSCVTVGVAFTGNVRIGKNCFIGTNATLAASIGQGSLIGAGTVIRHEVPPEEVWVGNPGRFLRKG
ncbi:MAG: DapH/DapD/GlmU-related protein [bacterium]|nr:DapH/DapD/GlmU-related protein [bacterium]